MIDAICNKITSKIRREMPEINDEKAEIINYGLQLIVGEIPKFLLLFMIAYLLKVLELSILALITISPYRMVSGGVHLKTHLGCLTATALFYIGNAFLSKTIILESKAKLIICLVVWIFSMLMIKLYAPADTEAVPILRKKERKIKQILSYGIMTITICVALRIRNSTISNILLFGVLLQTIAITRFMYKITNNKYGHEVYNQEKK